MTGLLLYAEMAAVPGAPGLFVQWIEGPEASLDALYDTIQDDDRHTDVEILGRGRTTEFASDAESMLDPEGRLFPIWSLGMVRLNQLPATLDGFPVLRQSVGRPRAAPCSVTRPDLVSAVVTYNDKV